MRRDLFQRLCEDLVARGCTRTAAPVAFETPNKSMRIDYAGLERDDLVDFLDQLVRRRQQIHGSVEVVGQETARAAYDDVELVIASVKTALRHAVADATDGQDDAVVNPRTPHVRQDQELRRAIAPYENGAVMLWSYSASHRTLVLRLTRDGSRGNVHVICEGCSSITGPSQWGTAALRIVDDGTRVKLEDAPAGFAVDCSLVRIDRDVPPVY